MRKIEIALAVAFGLVCWGQSSFAADDSDSMPSTAVPSPTTSGTGGGWQGKGRMRGAGKGGGMQGLGKGGGGAGRHVIKEALSLQSLTADQRTKIQAIADNLKQEGKALKAAAEAGNAGGAASGASGAAGGGAGRGEFRQKRKAAEQQVRALLSPAQLKELDAQSTAGQLVAPKGGAAASGDGS